jgi:hypothetical protein
LSSTTQFVSIIIILLALATNLILTQTIRRRRSAVPLRPVRAFEMLPLMVGEAIEADRPLHLSLGHVGLGGDDTVLTLAAAELAYQAARRAAIGATAPIVTVSHPSALPLAQDTLRRAYFTRDRLVPYSGSRARWYPSNSQTLAFAAALTATMGDARAAGNILAGRFGPELALVLEHAQRRRIPTIATSASLDGQAVAYVMADFPLIGEEVFAAGGYLGESAGQTATVATIDVLRGLLILGILLPAINALTDGALLDAVVRLLEGR